MRNIFEDIQENFQTKELVASFLLTVLFLFLALIGYTRLTTVQVVDTYGNTWTIHASFFGYPLQMVRVLTPIGSYENSLTFIVTGAGTMTILLNGLFLDFALYFSLAFVIVYSAKKLRNRWFPA
jgi:hypothetical protein